MKENIMFVIPPILSFDELKTLDKRKYPIFIHKSVPIGLLSIASYIKTNMLNIGIQIEIQILDINTEIVRLIDEDKIEHYSCIDEILDDIIIRNNIQINQDIIGISSLFSSTYSYLQSISNYFKNKYKDVFIIAGGSVPTVMYKEILTEISTIDAISLGEGEIPIYELLTTENVNSYIESKDYWVNRAKLQKDDVSLFPYYMDLSKMPKIDYSLIDLGLYQNNKRSSQNNSSTTISIMTSRGCPHKCCFCASHSVHGRRVRFIETQNIIDEMNTLITKYDVKTFLIEDDHFFLKKERALEILNAVKDKNVNIEFPNGVAVYSMDREIISMMKSCGTNSVSLAVESGSERILKDIIHKPLKLRLVKPIVDILREFDIQVHGLFIIGFPGETEEDRQSTIDFVKNVGFDSVSINIATPLVGSELYNICKEKNYLISDSLDNLYTAVGNIKTESFTPEYIEECRTLMNLELNYIYNYDYRNANYEGALKWFEYIIYRVPNHAFAYYYASKCYEELKNYKATEYMDKFNEIINTIPSWYDYAKRFKLIS